jgi:hypothetical protein
MNRARARRPVGDELVLMIWRTETATPKADGVQDGVQGELTNAVYRTKVARLPFDTIEVIVKFP